MPGKSISCLGYTPKPVQTKNTDTVLDNDPDDRFKLDSYPTMEEWRIYLKKTGSRIKTSKVHGYGKELSRLSQVLLNQILGRTMD